MSSCTKSHCMKVSSVLLPRDVFKCMKNALCFDGGCSICVCGDTYNKLLNVSTVVSILRK